MALLSDTWERRGEEREFSPLREVLSEVRGEQELEIKQDELGKLVSGLE